MDLEAEGEHSATDDGLISLRRQVIFAAIFTIPLVIVAVGKMLPGLDHLFMSVMPHCGWMWIEWLLATPVQFYAGRRFYRSGLAELKHMNPGMNSLVMIGSSAAYFYSVAALLISAAFAAGTAETYSEAAGVIITLILVGRYLEHIAKGRTSEAIKKLLQLQAKTARVLREGELVELPIEAVVPGDRVLARPGGTCSGGRCSRGRSVLRRRVHDHRRARTGRQNRRRRTGRAVPQGGRAGNAGQDGHSGARQNRHAHPRPPGGDRLRGAAW